MGLVDAQTDQVRGEDPIVVKVEHLALAHQFARAVGAVEEDVAEGVPVLRIPNLQADGWDLSDLKYLPLTHVELTPYRLEKMIIYAGCSSAAKLAA